MKKKLCCVLAALGLLLLCACGQQKDSAGETVKVDFEAGTVFDGTHTYRFTFSGDREDYTVNITFPDGSTYYETRLGGPAVYGWSDDDVEGRYMSGDALCDLIASKAPADGSATLEKVFFALVLVGVGAFCIVKPHAAWHLSHGWKYKNAQPTDIALGIQRVSGVIAILAGVGLFFL